MNSGNLKGVVSEHQTDFFKQFPSCEEQIMWEVMKSSDFDEKSTHYNSALEVKRQSIEGELQHLNLGVPLAKVVV